MFVRVLIVLVIAVGAWAFFVRDTVAGGGIERYRVKPGDSLWSISTAHYAGDPREGVWLLRTQNRLDGVTITPGQVLRLP